MSGCANRNLISVDTTDDMVTSRPMRTMNIPVKAAIHISVLTSSEVIDARRNENSPEDSPCHSQEMT